MGTKISKEEPIVGGECEHFYEPENTPEKIYVYFWEMVKCDAEEHTPPNMHLFALTQSETNPCIWLYCGTDYPFDIVLYWYADSVVFFTLRDKDGHFFFETAESEDVREHHIFDNVLNVCNGFDGAMGGNAFIIWKQAAVDLINSMVLPTESNILFEVFVTDEGKPVYKFCFPKYSMNIKILVTP